MYALPSSETRILIDSTNDLSSCNGISVEDGQAILVTTNDNTRVAMRFSLKHLDKNNLIVNWLFAPAGSSVTVP